MVFFIFHGGVYLSAVQVCWFGCLVGLNVGLLWVALRCVWSLLWVVGVEDMS